MQILLPSSLEWNAERFEGAEAVTYDPEREIPASLRGARAAVVWGNPRWQRRHMAQALPELRWVQGLAAGADGLLRAGFGEDVVLTSGRGLHDRPVAEHTLALALAAARRLHELRDAQGSARWRADLGGIQRHAPGETFRSLLDARVTIWGFGSIARTLAPLLEALGGQVEGIATAAGTRAGVRVHARESADERLAHTDLLITILPKAAGTTGMVGARALARLPAHAWLVNVGRGGTVDEAAMVRALRTGSLAGAALDVFEQEPLPEDSPLWRMENVIVTPHAAGGRPYGAEALVLRNLARFREGRPLENTIDRERGY